MDIHKKSWSVHLRTDISDHKTMTTPPNPEILYDYVATNSPDYQVRLTYEAGCCGYAAARFFLNMGWEVLVVNPADVPRINKQTYQKTDKIDCRNLSKQLHAGQLKGIFIPDENQDQLKNLVRQRQKLQGNFEYVNQE
jgi:hypothetical protein